jgi:hypothetical protein
MCELLIMIDVMATHPITMRLDAANQMPTLPKHGLQSAYNCCLLYMWSLRLEQPPMLAAGYAHGAAQAIGCSVCAQGPSSSRRTAPPPHALPVQQRDVPSSVGADSGAKHVTAGFGCNPVTNLYMFSVSTLICPPYQCLHSSY